MKVKKVSTGRIFYVAALQLFLQLLLFTHANPAGAQTRSFFFEIRSAAYKGLQLYEEGSYAAAIPLLEQAVGKPGNRHNPPLLLSLAHAHALSGSPKSAAECYSLLQETNFALKEEHLLLYANALMASGKLEEGRLVLVEFLSKTGKESEGAEINKQLPEVFYRDSIRYRVSPVSINSAAAEFSPIVVPNGILFVSERPKARLVQKHFAADESSGMDIFYGRMGKERDIRQIVRLNETVNTQMPEGPVSVFDNGRKLVFTRSGSNGEMQLYQAKSIFNSTTWFDEERVILPVKGSVGHPAMANNGEVLYFVSDMAGGYGGTDIYKIEKINGAWTGPKNLGPKVNTAGNEMFPGLYGTGKLYFASNGHFGLGGLDIYEASITDGSIVAVRNMGVPVNSGGDDFGLSWHESGDWAYFSSSRAGGAGKDDIYRLEVHTLSLEARVYDKVNRKSVANAHVSLLQNNVLLQEAVTDKKGNFTFRLYPGQEYELQYAVEEFRNFKEVISTRQGPRFGSKKWETGLDRKVKMFVLGTIKNSEWQRALGTQMLVIDQSGGRIDTVFADKRGNYEMELDAMSQYTFHSSCNSEAAVTTFSTPERGKASLSYYVDIELQPVTTYQVRGQVKIPAGVKGPFVISRLNKLNLLHDYIITDARGRFTFEASTLEEFELCLMGENNSPPVLLMPGWNGARRTVLLGW